MTPPRIALKPLVAVLTLAALAGAATASAGEAYPWLGLADGQMGGFQWSVKVKRPKAPAPTGVDGARRPCLLVGTKFEFSSYSFRRSRYRSCADATDGIRPKDPPLMASGIQPSAAPRGLTAVGLLVSPKVRRIWVDLTGGRQMTVHLRQMTPKQARAARIRRYRYAAFVVRGEWCAERMITYDGRGRTLYESGEEGFACGY